MSRGMTTPAAAKPPWGPLVRRATGTATSAAISDPRVLRPIKRPAAMPPKRVTDAAGAVAPSAPSAGTRPRRRARPDHGDELWPIIAAAAAAAASAGRLRPASRGPTAPLATSKIPLRATSATAAPSTEPVFALLSPRLPIPVVQRTTRSDHGRKPARKPAGMGTHAGTSGTCPSRDPKDPSATVGRAGASTALTESTGRLLLRVSQPQTGGVSSCPSDNRRLRSAQAHQPLPDTCSAKVLKKGG